MTAEAADSDIATPASTQPDLDALREELEQKPEMLRLVGKVLDNFAVNPEAMERWLQAQEAQLEAIAAGLETAAAETQEGADLAEAQARVQQLTEALQSAREMIAEYREAIAKLTAMPNGVGVVQSLNEDGETAMVIVGGREWLVGVGPDVEPDSLERGTKVLLNEGMVILKTVGRPTEGSIYAVKEPLDDGRLVLSTSTDEQVVVQLADILRGVTVKAGDRVMVSGNTAYELMPRDEVRDVMLEDVPDISYSDIGGLDRQLEKIHNAIELPFLYPDLYREHKEKPPKGVLLSGPPGCGKTLIAKAIANSLAKRVAEERGENVRSYFFSINGPELLNKWVGETERKIREVFKAARDKAGEGIPVIIFIDEMESLLRTRGSGISSDIEGTIVPQFLAEMDGVEGLDNVIVIGATNRDDLIDPAVMRPGRLDVKVKVERPDREAARDIFKVYVSSDLPLDAAQVEAAGGREELVERMIEAATEAIYNEGDANRFMEVTYEGGNREMLYRKDFSSGAMIRSIVSRANQLAIGRRIATKGAEQGLRVEDFVQGVAIEFEENQAQANAANPDDWAKISGRQGRIIHVRPVTTETNEVGPARPIDTTRDKTGQYL